jgi:hypothetical protein
LHEQPLLRTPLPHPGRDASALRLTVDTHEMTAELDELKKILDSKTPLRHGGAGGARQQGRASANAGSYDASPGGGSSSVMGGERIPLHLDVNSIMKRFNSAGPMGGSACYGSPTGGGPGAALGTPAEEISYTLKSYDDAVAGAEVSEGHNFAGI